MVCLCLVYNLLSNSLCISPRSVTKFLPSGASAWSWEAAGHEHGSLIQPRWLAPGAWDQPACWVTSLSLKEKKKKGVKEKEKNSQIGGQMLITFTCKVTLISLPSAKLVIKIWNFSLWGPCQSPASWNELGGEIVFTISVGPTHSLERKSLAS